MIIKQLWSKCRCGIVFPKRVMTIEIEVILGWKDLTILSLVFPFGVLSKQILRNIVLFLIIQSKIPEQQTRSDYIIEMYRLSAFHCIFTQDASYTHLKNTI